MSLLGPTEGTRTARVIARTDTEGIGTACVIATTDTVRGWGVGVRWPQVSQLQ